MCLVFGYDAKNKKGGTHLSASKVKFIFQVNIITFANLTKGL
jgi:hypothetical protein